MRELLSGYFSLAGRLSLDAFWRLWLKLVIVTVLVVVAAIFISMQGFPIAGYVAVAAITLLLLSNCAIFVRRLHDRGLSGWFAAVSAAIAVFAHAAEKSSSAPIILLLVPLAIAQIWLAIETCFRRGKAGPNRYGPDPMA